MHLEPPNSRDMSVFFTRRQPAEDRLACITPLIWKTPTRHDGHVNDERHRYSRPSFFQAMISSTETGLVCFRNSSMPSIASLTRSRLA